MEGTTPMTERHPVNVASSAAFSHLPKYGKPPVVEVAIGVQFEDCGFQPVHFGLLYEVLRDRFPLPEYHMPLPSVVELFDAAGAPRSSMSIESEFPIGRCWYQSEDGHQLIQVQPDRFVVNWRKLDTDIEYPSYETLREAFRNELELFVGFLSDNDLDDFEPTQCELTYVNHITVEHGWHGYRDLPTVLASWSGKTTEPSLPDVEDMKIASSYRLEENGAPIGRLHVQATSAIRKKDNSPALVLQLTARGAPLGDGINGTISFSDRAHEWIARAFTSLTTPHMHRIWERQR